MGLVVKASYIRCLVIAGISMRFRGAKRRGDALKSSFRLARQAAKGVPVFMETGVLNI